jgi:hypothetical protein
METLYVVACVAIPLRWRSRIAPARAALADWLKEPKVHITLAECAYGSRGWDLADLVLHVSRTYHFAPRPWLGRRNVSSISL